MVTFQIPSKTFILGEYLVLKSLDALLMNTHPCFEISFHEHKTLHPFHPHSPAGQLILDNQDIFEGIQIQFKSPHIRGGFGGSTAEFLGVYAYVAMKNGIKLDLNLIRYTYLTYASQKRGFPPSGADLLSQCMGHFTQIQNGNATRFEWPFADHSILIARTGNKTKTHQHLMNLTYIPSQLDAVVNQAMKSIKHGEPEQFMQSINDYHDILHQHLLVTHSTKQIVDSFQTLGIPVGIKGCGAMGADVILCFCANRHFSDVREHFKKLGLSILATQADTANGIFTTEGAMHEVVC